MRTQFGSIPLLTLVAASLTAGAGCSDLSAGTLNPPKGGPKLVRAMVQDYRYFGTAAQRGSAIDLLDTGPPPACADDNPCETQFLIARTVPSLECSAPSGGVCLDPLAVPASGVPLSAGHTGIRLVFNKQLDPKPIQTIQVDDNGAQLPGQTNSLNAGIVEVLDPSGTALPQTAFWDDTGSPTTTSDVVLVPFGPAIVINPLPLQASTKYTIRLHTALLKDKTGEAATDAQGAPLADPTDLTFTTEALTDNPGASSHDFTMGATIAPNDILQLAFWEGADEATVTLTATGPAGFDPAAVEAYSDRGDSPAAADCGAAEDATLLDFVYTTGSGAARMPIDWPPGDYTLSYSVESLGGLSTYHSPSLSFTVAGADATDPDADPAISSEHVTPEQCL